MSVFILFYIFKVLRISGVECFARSAIPSPPPPPLFSDASSHHLMHGAHDSKRYPTVANREEFLNKHDTRKSTTTTKKNPVEMSESKRGTCSFGNNPAMAILF